MSSLNNDKEIQAETIDREQLFIDYLHEYRSPVKAAKKAGYSDSYAKNIINRKLSDPKFISRLKEQYKGRKAVSLHVVDHIEELALAKYIDQPELAIKNPGLLKDIKTAAGIQQEEERKTTFINIKNLQELSLQILQAKQEPKQIDAEVTNID